MSAWDYVKEIGTGAAEVAEVAGGHLPIAGTIIHGAEGAYHGYKMIEDGAEAERATDFQEAQRLRAESIHHGHEAEQNAVQAIPLFGLGWGLASLAGQAITGQDPAETIWGEPTSGGE